MSAQENIPNGKCEETSKIGKPKTAPVVFGKPYIVPELKLRFLDERTDEPFVNRKVYFHYAWTWFDFLDKWEGRTGTTKQTSDLFLCKTDENGVVFLPERTVKPVGYNSGKKPFFWTNTTPQFIGIQFNIHLEGYISTSSYSKKMIDKIKQEKPEYIVGRFSKISPLD